MATGGDVTSTDARRWRRFWLLAFGIAVMVAPWIGAAPIHFAAPIEGRVVDADSKQPLPGVVVVADWPKHCGILHGTTCGRFAVHEAVTGEDGRYRISGWGPKLRAFGFGRFDVRVYFFKERYRKADIGNPWLSRRMGLWNRADWIHEVSLQKVPLDDAAASQAYATELYGLAGFVERIERDGVRPSTAVPRLLEEMAAARQSLSELTQ
jgi:hypothetical protein